MAMSGIEVDPEVTTLFNEMKMKHTHKWITFKIADDKKSITVDEMGKPHPTTTREEDSVYFDELKAKMKTDKPRYILYDFGFQMKKDSRRLEKLAFIFWCDDSAPIKQRMLYASSKDTVKKCFTGIAHEFQAKDMGDFDYDEYAGEVEKKA